MCVCVCERLNDYCNRVRQGVGSPVEQWLACVEWLVESPIT